jgi:hypothetical protein
MKKRIVSIVLLVVLLLGIALTVSAECNHEWDFLYEEESSDYYYHSPSQCAHNKMEYYKCIKCPAQCTVTTPLYTAHDFDFVEQSAAYYYYDDTYCERIASGYEQCQKCNYPKPTPAYRTTYPPHSFGPLYYMGTLPSGEQWWYHDCINCGARIDVYIP